MIALLTLAGMSALGWYWLWRRSRFEFVAPAARQREEREVGTLETVMFAAVDGTSLEGWLIRPHSAKAPLVIMAPGLTGTKEGLLEAFAWRFAAEGIATLMFDYRCFGGSEGTPRQWVDLSRHQQDYQAALRFAREQLAVEGHVDRDRIALWGSSFSGGTVLVTAARDRDVRAVIAQGPFLETTPELQPKGLSMARYVFWSVLDMLPFLPPVYIPVFGRPGEWVFAPSAENPSVKGFDVATSSRFWQALPRQYRGGWENRMLARMLTTFDDVVPMRSVDSLEVPVMFVAAERDDLIPVALVREAHARLKADQKELLVLPCGHFDLYIGPESERNRDAQADFLTMQLAAR
jgi:pimeloyl-ACP methyl ester carboxylesterase